jgi:hypothetical protein
VGGDGEQNSISGTGPTHHSTVVAFGCGMQGAGGGAVRQQRQPVLSSDRRESIVRPRTDTRPGIQPPPTQALKHTGTHTGTQAVMQAAKQAPVHPPWLPAPEGGVAPGAL